MSSSIFLFGSLPTSFRELDFSRVCQQIRDRDVCSWMLDTVVELPQYWSTIAAAIPSLHISSTREAVESLAEAALKGDPLGANVPLKNTILIPLAVAQHLIQYADFLRRTGNDIKGRGAKQEMTTLGLCTGILSAFAVSSARRADQLANFGAVALRLGMLIGMIIDAQAEASKSLTVAWASAESGQEAKRIWSSFPSTYASVYFDENRATVTTRASIASDLQHQLKKPGISASEIGLYGAFHSDTNRTLLKLALEFCDSHPEFQFADISSLAIQTRSNCDGRVFLQGLLHHHALEEILVEPPEWFQTFRNTIRDMRVEERNTRIFSFGPERIIPPSLMHSLRTRVFHLADINSNDDRQVFHDNDIAVVGMACKVAGADDVLQFWDLMCSGQSQHKEVNERFSFQTPFRDVDPLRSWYANLINDADAFDHRFFKKSARESATMDPQQRHMLQIAYQAVEQSGYFHNADPERRIGCYVGVRGCDYYDNIACHAPNAFGATGNLQAFIAGKISHHFGWTGPGMTIDTACSSSLVAIHQACRAIISGECKAALAGGTHIMTSPLWFQNLASASFLSPSGQCKPFDAKADGYCRGDGVGAVFLKKLSDATRDGDQILGVVRASAVQQNQNITPIFVPNAASLSSLFRTVTSQARINPAEISVVEAHGTGTPVGDPAEYDGIRQVLADSDRTTPLVLGSVKGLVGHTECASGIVSMVKALLMIQKRAIPPQASFSSINPNINAVDQIRIPTELLPWEDPLRAVLINNYGASGSNASIVVAQPPSSRAPRIGDDSSDAKYPFWLCGLDNASLSRYIKLLQTFLRDVPKDVSLSNLSFNLARQSNRLLDRSVIFSARSVNEVEEKLASYQKDDRSAIMSSALPPPRPVILCFGGQVSTFIGLDPGIYKRVAVFRKHIDSVDWIVRSLGAGAIVPGIFERAPIQDTVALQTMLFAIQYASALSFIDSGIQPAALVGYSFGELTALCVAQVLSLDDALRMIISRATLIRDCFGNDKGGMIAVEAELSLVENLLTQSEKLCATEKPATIACYNGPTSFTLAGSTAAIDAVADMVTKTPAFSSIRTKRLNVTNSFHCSLVEPLLEHLEEACQELKFHEPQISLERSTEFPADQKFAPKFVSEHLRSPVFFHNAVKRIHQKYPSAIFLEAGSNSTITSMASRALGNPGESLFQALNITSDESWNKLTDTTLNLWKAGVRVHHWAHQATQSKEHSPLLLPPYQFERSRHWLELKEGSKQIAEPAMTTPEEEMIPDTLLTFSGYSDDNRLAKFRVNTMIPQYDQLTSGHMIVQTAPICPATVQIGLVIDALTSLRPELVNLAPQISDVDYQSPLCANPERATWIQVAEALEGQIASWKFELFSTDVKKGELKDKMLHTTGKIGFCDAEEPRLKLELTRFERLFGYQRCVDLLESNKVDDILQSRTIYRLFSDIVEYGEEYRGVQKMVVRSDQSVAHIVRKGSNSNLGWDAHLADNFCQIGGIWVNSMTERKPTDVYIASGIEQWIRSPRLCQEPAPRTFHVLAAHSRPSDRQCLTDVFIFDATDGTLVEIILGLSYIRVSKASLSKLLARLSVKPSIPEPSTQLSEPQHMNQPFLPPVMTMSLQPETIVQTASPTSKAKVVKQSRKLDITAKVKLILSDLAGIEPNEIKDDSQLGDLGIDSLTGIELVHEIEVAFKIKLPTDELADMTDLPSLLHGVQTALGASIEDTEDAMRSNDESAESDGRSSNISRSTTSILTEPTSLCSESAGSQKSLNGPSSTSSGGATIPFATLKKAFNETKALVDKRIAEFGQDTYVDKEMPIQTELCIALTLEAFEQLGSAFRGAESGQQFDRIPYEPKQRFLVNYLYEMLEKETQGIIVKEDHILRTAVPLSTRSSKDIFQEALDRFPDQDTANKLTFYAGSNLVNVLSGKTDGVRLIFGSPEGRDLVSRFYADWPLNQVLYLLMEDFLGNLIKTLDLRAGPLKILEMGAGTGGTTKRLLPFLAKLNVPVEYTFTDLAGSFVAGARKRFSREYPFMKFRTHDIESAPDEDLIGTQHIIIASNAVHATHSIYASTKNVRKMLRADGFLLMLEMTRTPRWVDIIFGLFEGWWLFDDGRTHALTHESRWEKDLQAAGYGHVDWTEGSSEEADIEKLIIATASGPRCERSPIPNRSKFTDFVRESVIDAYVKEMTQGLGTSSKLPSARGIQPSGKCVLITGATGSLGAHLVADALLRPHVRRVICLNRRSKQDPRERQLVSLAAKGITLQEESLAKLTVLAADLSQTNLGLPAGDYEDLTQNVTHLIHNAWHMSLKWPLKRFEPQLRIMRNMLDLSYRISTQRLSCGAATSKTTFQFISSIATVGHWPVWKGKPGVPEDRMESQAVFPSGYGDAKYICERMLDETLHRHPEYFRTMAVRLGQIAGSSSSGYWNKMEHVSFLIKSSQTLNALPDFNGVLSWTPVNDVAGTLLDLAMLPEHVEPYPIYHIDNPVRQSWKDMTSTLADALDIPRSNTIPFQQWVQRVKDYSHESGQSQGPDGSNPAALLIDFLDDNFIRMSCGGLLLSTAKAREHSETLANLAPVSETTVRMFVERWKDTGFLK